MVPTTQFLYLLAVENAYVPHYAMRWTGPLTRSSDYLNFTNTELNQQPKSDLFIYLS